MQSNEKFGDGFISDLLKSFREKMININRLFYIATRDFKIAMSSSGTSLNIADLTREELNLIQNFGLSENGEFDEDCLPNDHNQLFHNFYNLSVKVLNVCNSEVRIVVMY